MTISFVALIVVIIALILTTAVNPNRTDSSSYELDRRERLGDKSARLELRRERLLPLVLSLRSIKVALELVLVTLLSVATFDWLVGVFVAVVVSLEYGALARLAIVRKFAARIYEKIEPTMLKYVEKAKPYIKYVQSIKLSDISSSTALGSREELVKLVEESAGVLTPNEKALLKSGLTFSDKVVKDFMTSRSDIDVIKKSEFLGPLTLSELHQLGHSRLPVINQDIDHVVGVLHIRDLLSLDNKKSVTVEKAMETKVFYIREDQSLEHALAAFIKTRHHMFIVINQKRETVGLITLDDVIEALVGRKLHDEYESHHDARAVASRNLSPLNNPSGSVDV